MLLLPISHASHLFFLFFFFNDTATTEIYTLSLHDALPIFGAAGFPDDANPFFSAWMVAWSRRVFIAKALATIRNELAASARRTASKGAEKIALPPRNWTLDRDTTKVQLESALLTIDVFPRCALVLSVFEGVSLEDVALLLDSERDLVRKAQMIG